MTIRMLTQPPVEPLTLTEAKLFCRIDADDVAQDAVVTALIVACRQYMENYTRRAFVQRQFEKSFDCAFNNFELVLAYPPLVSVDEIAYTNLGGGTTIVDPATYQVDSRCEPARIKPVYLGWWPTDVRSSDYNPVRVKFTAGYALGVGSPTDYTSSIPEAAKLWMKARVVDLYHHRGTFVQGTIVSPLPRSHIDGMLDHLIVDIF